jgi:hypothetical protein
VKEVEQVLPLFGQFVTVNLIVSFQALRDVSLAQGEFKEALCGLEI